VSEAVFSIAYFFSGEKVLGVVGVGSEVQGFRGSGVQRFRGSEVQGFRGSGVQGFRVQPRRWLGKQPVNSKSKL